ncbi:YheC/YheD family protein [Bacillus sp. CGMCC 1.16541]|uniref:YheC/YheD family endospore coat-associated protein n=1 Tax=Bacillus sp. CGMCC 1.16541 TaxID=2185143 RepID=UPI000D73F8A1|nr:YheC/YheD family protein [Bacillus sp. CGMCC 1.16541]
MTRIVYQMSLVDEPSHIVYVPKSYKSSTLTHVAFGTLSLPCVVKTHASLQNEILLSTSLFEQLSMPFCQTIYLFQTEDTLHIGPLIGILSAGFTGSLLRPVGKRSLPFAKLLSTATATGGYPFVFGIHHINWNRGRINGYFYTNDGWEQHEVPFPNVVYNRLPNRKTENLDMFQLVKEKLCSQYLIPLFNPDFFDKWTIDQLMRKNEQTAKLLPETYASPDASRIQSMLSKHRSIYLKPKDGSLGNGVYEVTLCDNNTYRACYKDSSSNQLVTKTLHSLDDVFSLLDKQALPSYLVQQSIPLMTKQGRKVDFRVHTNKNEHGQWVMTVAAAKLAAKNSVTTHVNSGGTIKTLEEIYDCKVECQKVKGLLEKAAILASNQIEQHIDGVIGEIGFDFGLDKDQNLWIFEANSKPGRSIFTHPKLYEADQLTRKYSLLYATHLAEESMCKPGEIYV